MNPREMDQSSVKDIDKYYNDIINNLRLNLQVAEERVRRLQGSEFKLECEIETLKNELSEIKDKKKLINKSNHILSYIQETN